MTSATTFVEPDWNGVEMKLNALLRCWPRALASVLPAWAAAARGLEEQLIPGDFEMCAESDRIAIGHASTLITAPAAR